MESTRRIRPLDVKESFLCETTNRRRSLRKNHNSASCMLDTSSKSISYMDISFSAKFSFTKKESETKESISYSCQWEDCNRKFETVGELGDHVRLHIAAQKKENRRNKTRGFYCKWRNCNREKAFKGLYNLDHHLRYQHTGEKPYSCEKCPSVFGQESDLKEHLIKIHQEKVPSKPRKSRSPKLTKAKKSDKNRSSSFPPNSKKEEVEEEEETMLSGNLPPHEFINFPMDDFQIDFDLYLDNIEKEIPQAFMDDLE